MVNSLFSEEMTREEMKKITGGFAEVDIPIALQILKAI